MLFRNNRSESLVSFCVDECAWGIERDVLLLRLVNRFLRAHEEYHFRG
jgi:hypothetical protein